LLAIVDYRLKIPPVVFADRLVHYSLDPDHLRRVGHAFLVDVVADYADLKKCVAERVVILLALEAASPNANGVELVMAPANASHTVHLS
jgi:hypothetical protein